MFPRVLSRDQACCCFGVVFSGALLFLGQSKERTSCQSFKLHCHTNILFGRWGGVGGAWGGGGDGRRGGGSSGGGRDGYWSNWRKEYCLWPT